MRVRLLTHLSGGFHDAGTNTWREYGARLDEIDLPDDHAQDLINQGHAVAVAGKGKKAEEKAAETPKE